MRIIRKIWCCIFGHNFLVAQHLTVYSRRIYCKCCKDSYGMNDDTRTLILWSPDFHRMYESHGIEIKYRDEEFHN